MYIKLSARNVKRSFKDYFIYFLTLTFAVCIFYSFNSLSEQKAMMDASSSTADIYKVMLQLIEGISVFVSIVLGFLIIFANNFLIKRRKKELGLYTTLGMSKYKISRILVLETFFIGIISLGVGLAAGVMVSQGLSIVVTSLFKADITKYDFIFSSGALIKTVVYFGIIFLFVMLFNSVVISRYKLIDLLIADKQNERLKIRKTSTSVALFIISIVILGVSYAIMLQKGLLGGMSTVWTAVGLGSLGTFLFFMSLSGFALNLLQRNKNIYFKDVNMFVLRQINSKVNTTFISMTIICLMLFFTIGVLSTGFSLNQEGSKRLDLSTPYDASVSVYVDKNSSVKNIDDAAKKLGIDWDNYGEAFRSYQYETNVNFEQLLFPYIKDQKLKRQLKEEASKPIVVISKSDYNRLVQMQGKKAIPLQDDEVLLVSNVEDFIPTLNNFHEHNKTIVLNKQEYNLSSKGIHKISLKTDYFPSNLVQVVAPDEAVNKMKPISSSVTINYNSNAKQHDEELYHLLNSFMKDGENQNLDFSIFGATKQLVLDMSIGNSTIFIFIGIYLGIIFLISSAAILALQQLSEASDNIQRYTILKKIGVTKAGIHKSIFRQVFIYFMMPLSLAIVHSIFGIQVVNDAVKISGADSVLIPSFITALIMIVVYGGYFVATYTGYKNIVK
ncbi:ABC transporter permease [Bacillus sp. JJ722]|uniref:ABC transporter permease n=1 Tax=Bacillus sp. JJ722 TaxID=3122973 RepID=UPI002FFFC66E